MTKKETAEQKLLKIIEAQGQAESSSAHSPTFAPDIIKEVARSLKGMGLPTLNSFLMPLLAMVKGVIPTKSSAVSLGLKEVNRLFMIGIAIACLLFAINILNGFKLSNQKVSFPVTRMPTDLSESFIPSLKDISEYLANIEQRNIFRPFEKKESESQVITTPAENQRLRDLTKDWKLVGIAWLDTPESASVMIEDIKTGLTYFLKQGEEFHGVTIKKIYADRVIFGCQGKELTFKL